MLALHVMGHPEHLYIFHIDLISTFPLMTPCDCLARAQETTGPTSWGSPDAPHLESALDSLIVPLRVCPSGHMVPAIPIPKTDGHGSFSSALNLFPTFLPYPKLYSFFFNWKFFSCSLLTKTWMLTDKLGLDE